MVPVVSFLASQEIEFSGLPKLQSQAAGENSGFVLKFFSPCDTLSLARGVSEHADRRVCVNLKSTV